MENNFNKFFLINLKKFAINFLLSSKKNILSEQQIAAYCIRAQILEDITQLAKEKNIEIFDKQLTSQNYLALMIKNYLPMFDTCNKYKNQPKYQTNLC